MLLHYLLADRRAGDNESVPEELGNRADVMGELKLPKTSTSGLLVLAFARDKYHYSVNEMEMDTPLGRQTFCVVCGGCTWILEGCVGVEVGE